MAPTERTRSTHWPARGGKNRLEPECWPIIAPTFSIDKGASIFTMGSCFARNIESHLYQLGYDVTTLNFLKEHPELAQSIGVDALNKYTPPSMYQELAWTRAIQDRDDTVRMTDIENFLYELPNGNVVDLQRRAPASGGVSREAALEERKLFYQLSKAAFRCDVAIITLGYIECWRDDRRDTYVELVPRMHPKDHGFVFELLDYPKSLSYVQRTIDLLNRDSKKKILITTSPVPIWRTFTDDDIVVANTYSKSVLRAVAGAVAMNNDCVDYFPSYESVMLTKANEIWQNDLRHVDSAFVGRIMLRVTQAYVSGGTGHETSDEAKLRFETFVNQADWPSARTAWKDISQSDVQDAGAFHVAAAEYLLHEGDKPSALRHVKMAVDAIPSVSEDAFIAHFRCATIADELGEPDLAEQHRRRGLDTIGARSMWWERLIWHLGQDHKTRDIEWVLRRAAEHDAFTSQTKEGLFRSAAGIIRKFGSAAQLCWVRQKLVEFEPNDTARLLDYGRSLLQTSNLQSLPALIDRLAPAGQSAENAAISGIIQDFLMKAAAAHIEAGQAGEAAAILNRVAAYTSVNTDRLSQIVIQLLPTDPAKASHIVVQKLARLPAASLQVATRLSRELIAFELYEAAEAYIRKVLESYPKNAKFHASLSRCLNLRGQRREAAFHAREAERFGAPGR